MPGDARGRRVVTKAARKLSREAQLVNPAGGADRGTQIALQLAYQQHAAQGLPAPSFHDVEFRNYSQNGEDGILLHLLALAGHGERRAVEMACGDGIECNTANLILHHGWDAHLVEGDPELIRKAEAFYAGHPETFRVGPRLTQGWITRETANAYVEDHVGPGGELDLLSLDIDGMDYWILEAITARPRIIVLEYNNRVPAGHSVTVPYQEDFTLSGDRTHGAGFFGASLDAFHGLLAGRGYRLVGANRQNTNAFFLRDDVLPDRPAVPVVSCLSSKWARTTSARWWPELESAGWQQV